MKTFLLLALSACMISCKAQAQTLHCSTEAAAAYGGWRSMKTVPRDGTAVELIQTYGYAPTYGLFRWSRFVVGIGDTWEHKHELAAPLWVEVLKGHDGIMTEDCLYWRPYKGKPEDYKDPTGGHQWDVAYWCSYTHTRYNKKKDACEP